MANAKLSPNRANAQTSPPPFCAICPRRPQAQDANNPPIVALHRPSPSYLTPPALVEPAPPLVRNLLLEPRLLAQHVRRVAVVPVAARVHHDGVVGGRRRGVGAALEAAGAADVVCHLDEVVDFALRGVSFTFVLAPSDET